MALKQVLAQVDADHEQAMDDLTAICRIPSVSAEKRAQPECAAAVRSLLESNRIPAKIIDVPEAPPVVYGEIRAGDDRPTLLLYNHYDVQPVDPRDEWHTDPFDPTVKEGKFYARGCADTKGNIVAQVAAVRAFLAVDGMVPCNLKFVIEGEEEVGSPHFRTFVEAHRELLKADGATIEGGDHSMAGVPRIEFGCKGTLYVELTSRTAAVDQHSAWAAILPNAAWRLLAALRTLRDERGKVLIPGWTDTAMKATRQQLAHLRKSEFDEKPLLKDWGIAAPLVEKSGYDLIRHALYSPTCTICGIVSGYQGPGTKTVNPAVASVKLDFRLLPGMKAMEQLEKLKAFLTAKGFADIDVHYHDSIEASATPYDTRVAKACIAAGKEVYGRQPSVWPWSLGASAYGFFNEVVGVPSVSGPGVGYEASRIHAPNEHIRLADFANGTKYMASLFARF